MMTHAKERLCLQYDTVHVLDAYWYYVVYYGMYYYYQVYSELSTFVPSY